MKFTNASVFKENSKATTIQWWFSINYFRYEELKEKDPNFPINFKEKIEEYQAWWAFQATDRHFKNYDRVRFEEIKASPRSIARYQGFLLNQQHPIPLHLHQGFTPSFEYMNFCLTHPKAIETISYKNVEGFDFSKLQNLKIGPYTLYLPQNYTEYLLGGTILRNCHGSLIGLKRDLDPLKGNTKSLDAHLIKDGKLVAMILLDELVKSLFHDLEKEPRNFILENLNKQVGLKTTLSQSFLNFFKKRPHLIKKIT